MRISGTQRGSCSPSKAFSRPGSRCLSKLIVKSPLTPLRFLNLRGRNIKGSKVCSVSGVSNMSCGEADGPQKTMDVLLPYGS